MRNIEQKSDWLEEEILRTTKETDKELGDFKERMKEHEGIEKAIENYDGSGFLDLSELEISSVHLETYWSDIVALEPKITSLDLSKNNIDYVGFMGDLSELTSLDLSYNAIEDLDAPSIGSIFEGCNKLKILNISHNSLIFFSTMMIDEKARSNIEVLDLSDNAFWEWEDAIILSDLELEWLNNLRILKAENNRITSLGFTLRNREKFSNLRGLFLSGNKINNFDFLKTFPNLNILDVSKNEFFNLNLVWSKLSETVLLNPGSSFEWIKKAKLEKLIIDQEIGDNRDNLMGIIPGGDEMNKAIEKWMNIDFV